MGVFGRLFGQRESARDTAPAIDGEPLLVNAYATVRDLPDIGFAHRMLGRRDLSDPDLAPHIAGFIGYAMSLGDGQMTATRYHLWRHLQRTRNQLSMEVAKADLPALEAWAWRANAILFLPDGSIRAPDLAALLTADGESDPGARLPYQPDAVARRERTLERLSARDPRPPAGMPPAIGEAEVVLRSADEVLRRALALFAVAATAQQRAGSPPAPTAGQPDRNPLGFGDLTPVEAAFVRDGVGDASALTWRYEAAGTLLWALGVDAAVIADSNAQGDVDAMWNAAEALAPDDAAPDRARLRPTAEILDALDRTWREHWIVRQVRPAEVDGISGDIVMERHHALNWLTGFQNPIDTPWDDIDTPT